MVHHRSVAHSRLTVSRESSVIRTCSFPSGLRRPRGSNTMPSADFWSHQMDYSVGPAFRASSNHGYASRSPQIRTRSVPTQVLDLPASTLPVRFHCQQPAHLRCRPLSSFCSSPDGSWREDVQQLITRWLIDHLRRLPLHGLSPRRSCPRLVLSFVRNSFGILTPRKKPELSTGDFHPTRSRPCWAYCTGVGLA